LLTIGGESSKIGISNDGISVMIVFLYELNQMGYQRAFILHFHRFVYSRKRTNQVTFFKKLFLSFTG